MIKFTFKDFVFSCDFVIPEQNANAAKCAEDGNKIWIKIVLYLWSGSLKCSSDAGRNCKFDVM